MGGDSSGHCRYNSKSAMARKVAQDTTDTNTSGGRRKLFRPSETPKFADTIKSRASPLRSSAQKMARYFYGLFSYFKSRCCGIVGGLTVGSWAVLREEIPLFILSNLCARCSWPLQKGGRGNSWSLRCRQSKAIRLTDVLCVTSHNIHTRVNELASCPVWDRLCDRNPMAGANNERAANDERHGAHAGKRLERNARYSALNVS